MIKSRYTRSFTGNALIISSLAQKNSIKGFSRKFAYLKEGWINLSVRYPAKYLISFPAGENIRIKFMLSCLKVIMQA